MIRRLGVTSLSAAIPAIPIALGQLSILLAPILGQVTQLQTTLALPIVVPDVAAYIAALKAAIANALDALTHLPAASVSLHVGLAAQISLLQGLILAAQAVIDTLSLSISAGGVAGYAYEGPAANLGGELQSAVSVDLPPIGTVYALILATATPATWSAMGTVLRTSP